MENFTTACQNGKATAEENLPQVSGISRDPQPRPRWELVRELRRVARKGSAAFFRWWWALPKAERRVLLDAAEVAAA